MTPISLKEIRAFLLDLDGTTYLGDRLLPGSRELLELLRARSIDYLFLSNNSSRHGRYYAEKLQRIGLEVDESQILTSGEAAVRYLAQRNPGARVFLVGTTQLEQQFGAFEFQISQEDPELVVLGFDTGFTYDKLWRLCDFVRAGVPYIATHPDLNCPIEDGMMPDIGATIAFVAASTGRQPDVILGKPNRPIVEAVVEKLGIPVEALCMVGDRLETDIAMRKWGITTVLVLSGETGREDLKASQHQPDYIFQDLSELVSGLS
jgi:HAD superfamily hydrolase (TIGR01457 family)